MHKEQTLWRGEKTQRSHGQLPSFLSALWGWSTQEKEKLFYVLQNLDVIKAIVKAPTLEGAHRHNQAGAERRSTKKSIQI